MNPETPPESTLQGPDESRLFFGLSPTVLAGLLALLTFGFHLAYGVWFWTRSPTDAPKTSLRLSGEAFLASYPGWDSPTGMDASAENHAAMEVLRTGVPRYHGGLFLHAPVYSYFLAVCYGLGGVRLLAVAVPQALFSGLTALVVGLIAYRLARQGKTLALLAAALLVLINIRLAGSTAYMVPVNILMFFFSAALFAVADHPLTGWAVAGFVAGIGLGIYTQAAFFTVGAATALWLLLRFRYERRWRLLAGAIVLLLLVAGKLLLSLVNLEGGKNDWVRQADRGTLWLANNPHYESLRWWDLWQLRLGPSHKWKGTAEQDRRYREYLDRAGGDMGKAAMLWIRENPAQYAKLCFIRLRTELGPITGSMGSRVNRLASTVIWLLTFPAGFFGLWQDRRSPFAALAGLIILAVFALDTFILMAGQLRYRLPADLLLTIYAGVTYARLGCVRRPAP